MISSTLCTSVGLACFTKCFLGDTLVFMPESNRTRRNVWAQLGVSACALLLPPMALGAAVYSLLPPRDEGAARRAAGNAAEVQAATPNFRIEAAWPINVNANSQPVADPTASSLAAGKSISSAEGQSSVLPTNKWQEQVSKSVSKKDMARVMGPGQAGATAITPTWNPPSSGDADASPVGSSGAVPWRSDVPETPVALLPRVPTPLLQIPARQALVPRIPSSQVPSFQAPSFQVSPSQVSPAPQVPSSQTSSTPVSADRSSTHASPRARKHTHSSYLRNLAARGVRAEARDETPAARRSAQPQQTFSLKNWLQQLGTHPHNTGG
jgi:hypothetical protein